MITAHVTTTHSVDADGTIAWTNIGNLTTNYTYDAALRPRVTTPPHTNPIGIEYDSQRDGVAVPLPVEIEMTVTLRKQGGSRLDQGHSAGGEPITHLSSPSLTGAMMRQIILPAVFAVTLAASASASAQELSRFEVGPVARLDRVSIEGRAGGATVAAGLAASVRLWRGLGVEAEITQASRKITRSYEGWFVSYNQDRNATRAEIEAAAPTARRTLDYAPGLGWSGALVVRGQAAERVTMAARIGLSARRYNQTSSYVILTIPEGVDHARVAGDFQDSTASRTRGGLLFGVDTAIELTDHLLIVPDLRFVYGGPAQVGNKYREFGFGTRVVWRF